MSRNWKYEEKEDNRNYLLEARNLVKGLRGGQLYEMYEIVIKQLQRNNSPTKDKELSAVRDVIEQDRGVNAGRLGTPDVFSENYATVLIFCFSAAALSGYASLNTSTGLKT